MRGAVSKGGGNASLADEILVGGQGVRSDPESEGFEEKYRAVIDRGRPLMRGSGGQSPAPPFGQPLGSCAEHPGNYPPALCAIGSGLGDQRGGDVVAIPLAF